MLALSLNRVSDFKRGECLNSALVHSSSLPILSRIVRAYAQCLDRILALSDFTAVPTVGRDFLPLKSLFNFCTQT
nr:MAG TPA: hypothetical protein [Caudoviricetes sp.]